MKVFEPAMVDQLTGVGAQLGQRIANKEAIIGVVGLGYVGMPIALEFAKKGFQVRGVDVSARKIEALSRGENFIEDLEDEEVADVVSRGLFSASTSYEPLADADVVFIAVPTPFNANKDPDIT